MADNKMLIELKQVIDGRAYVTSLKSINGYCC